MLKNLQNVVFKELKFLYTREHDVQRRGVFFDCLTLPQNIIIEFE